MSNLALPNTITTPPGGWRYRVPETGMLFDGANLETLLNGLRAHYRTSGYDVPADLMQRVEAYICKEVPEYCGAGVGIASQAAKVEDTGLSFHEVVQGMRTLIGWIAGGGERVTMEVAEARASVCAACPLNVQSKGCSGCNLNILRQLVEKIVNRQVSAPERLKACKVCKCQLGAKIWLPRKNLWPKMSDRQKEQLPTSCWLVTEQTN